MDFGLGDALAMFGVGFSVYSKLESGRHNKQLEDHNAEIAGQMADDAIARGVEQERLLRGEYKKLVGTERNILASQGMDLEADTASAILLDTARQKEIDALTLRNNAAREAWGYKVQAYDYSAKGNLFKREADFGAFNTVLSGAADYALAQQYGANKKPRISRG